MRNKTGVVIGALLGWPGLAWCWWRVAEDGDAPTARMFALPVLLGVATALVTTVWVRHNRAIYRRKGARRAVPVAPFAYLTDRRGRRLQFDMAHPRSARHIVVSVGSDGAKHYREAS
jgi:hypothetical protein